MAGSGCAIHLCALNIYPKGRFVKPPFPEGLGASTIRLLTTLAWSSVGRAQKVGPQSPIDHRTALPPVGHRGPALQKTRSLRL